MQELTAYKREHGNCNVQQRQGRLGAWVKRQRTARREGKLSEDRVQRLTELGFNWGASRVISAPETRQPQEPEVAGDDYGDDYLLQCKLDKCLRILAVNCQQTNKLLLGSAFDRLRISGDWSCDRECIVRSTDGSWVADDSGRIVPINSDKMLIPVWTLRTSPTRVKHFVALVRFRDQEAGKWVFALVDSFAPQRYHLDEINSLLRDKSTLGCPEDMMNSDPNGTAHDNASRIELIPCRDQAGSECGYRVVLHLYFAMKSNTLEEYADKIRKLDSIDKLELNVKVRRWVMGVLSDNWDGTMPLWIRNITRLAN